MRTLIFFIVGALVTLSAMFCFWAASLGGYDGDRSSFLADVYQVKDEAAAKIAGPKIVLVSGSNALFGIDSSTLANLIGRPVLNMATHAGLPLPLLADRALKHVSAGDIVIVPLEFEYYRRDPTPSEFEALNIESWANDYALSSIPRAITYFRSSSMLRAARQLFAPLEPYVTDAEIVAAVAQNTARGVSIWRGYSALSLMENGDLLVDVPGSYHDDARPYVSDQTSQYALDDIASFKREVERRGALFWLTWPVTARNPAFDLRYMPAQEAAERLRTSLEAIGITIHCDAAAFQFEQRLFLDTEYHLGLEGAAHRTLALGSCLAGHPLAEKASDIVAKRREEARVFDETHQ